MDVNIWNVLHDGRIVAVNGTVPGDLQLSVEITYLCDQLQTRGSHLLLELRGCDQFEYRPYDMPTITDPAGVASLEPEILSAAPDGDCLSVECADGTCGGQLRVRYKTNGIKTAEGQLVSQGELELAAEHYWKEWDQRARKQRPDGI